MDLMSATDETLEKLLLSDFAIKMVDDLLEDAENIKLKDKKAKASALIPEYMEIEGLINFFYDTNPTEPKITFGRIHPGELKLGYGKDLKNYLWTSITSMVLSGSSFIMLPERYNVFVGGAFGALCGLGLAGAVKSYIDLKKESKGYYLNNTINLQKKDKDSILKSTFAHEYSHHILANAGVPYEDHQILHEGFARSSTRRAMKLFSKMKQKDEYYLAAKMFDARDLEIVKKWQATQQFKDVLRSKDGSKNHNISRYDIETMVNLVDFPTPNQPLGNVMFLILEDYFGEGISKKIFNNDLSPLEIFERDLWFSVQRS